MLNGLNETLRNTFSEVINAYEYARPKYPKELYERILSFSGINNKCYILEVGAGTGQATAFHWIDGEVGYPKAWRMLRAGGTMAVFGRCHLCCIMTLGYSEN